MHWKSDPTLYPPFLQSRIRCGRGVGIEADYIPWYKAREVPSRGTSSVVSSIKSKRPIHLLSELEATYYFLLERQPIVVDIREQWPILDIDRTLELALELDVKHPYRKTFIEPFTIDFLITELGENGVSYRAASIKTKEEAANPAIRRRLAVEHRWCAERDVPWVLVDTTNFDKQLLSNLRFMRSWYRHRFFMKNDEIHCFAEQFNRIFERNILLGSLITSAAQRLHIPIQKAEDLFRRCAWDGLLPISMTAPLSLDRPLFLNET